MAEINREDIFGSDLAAPLQELQGTLEDVLGTLDNLRQSGKSMEKTFKESGEVTKATSVSTKKLAADLEVLDKSEKKLDDTVKKSTKTQKESASAFKKTSESLDQLAPAQAGAVKGFIAMTKAAAAFLMTPIGLAIGLLAAAIGSLTAYFKGSEAGQNRFNRALAIGAEVLELITDYIELAGEAIFNTLGKAFEWLGSIAEKVFPNATAAVKAWVSDIVEEGNRIADIQEKFNLQERELIVERAKVAKEAAKLRNEAIELEGQARLDKVNQAIALEEGLLKKEIEFANTKLEIANKNASDDPTIENKREQAEAIANLHSVEQSYYDATKKFTSQKIALEKELHAAETARLQTIKEREIVEARIAEQKKTEIEVTTPAIIKGKLDEHAADHLVTEAKKNQTEVRKVALEQQQQEITTLQSLSNSFGQLANAMRKGTIAQKLFANAQAIINTYLGVTQVLRDPLLPTVAKAFAVASTIATGLAAIAKINNVKGFFRGTKSSPEGFAMVGERGAELMNVPGQGLMLSPNNSALTYLKKGTEIIPHEQSMAMLAGSGVDVGKSNGFMMLNHLQLVNDSVKQIGNQIVGAVDRSSSRLITQGTEIYELKRMSDTKRKLIRSKSFSS
jgi:hypothetical protein